MSTESAVDRHYHAGHVLSGDWDENGTTSVHLPRDAAEKLLKSLGWTQESRTLKRHGKRETYDFWMAPAETGDTRPYWLTSDALTHALIAKSLEAQS